MNDENLSIAIDSDNDKDELRGILGSDIVDMLDKDKDIVGLNIVAATMLLEHLSNYLSKAVPKLKEAADKIDLPDNLSREAFETMSEAQIKLAMEIMKATELSNLFDKLKEAVEPIHNAMMANASKLSKFKLKTK